MARNLPPDPEVFLSEFPSIPEDLLARLEQEYQPKCWNPAEVPEFQHHRYAGMVDLIQWLRAIQNARSKSDLGLDPTARHVTQEGGA